MSSKHKNDIAVKQTNIDKFKQNNPNVTKFRANQRDPDEEPEIEVVMANDIKPKQQPWFWPNVIPLDTSTLFAGFGNSGKSQLLIFMAAKTSTGESFNAGGQLFQFPQGGGIILSGEDDFEYQLIPRLIAANADLSKIHLLKMMKAPGKPKQLIDLDLHLSLLEKTIVDSEKNGNKIKFLIVDPVQYFTGEMKDFNPDVCRFVGALNDLAKKHNLALIMNKHLRKKGTGDGISSAVDSVSGSGAWTTAPRSCWLVQRHPIKENIILFADLKGNLKAKDMKCLAFKIDKALIDDPYNEGNKIETTAMKWLDELEDFNADSALNTVAYSALEQKIRQWIIDFLLNCAKNPNNGAMFSAAELGKEAISFGFSSTKYFDIRKKMINEGILSEVVQGKNKAVTMLKLTDHELYS